MSPSCALVFCVHHKPWLMQSTLITTMLQDHQQMDLTFIQNLHGGEVVRPSYAEYARLARLSAVNEQLSPFDERVREVCRLNRRGVSQAEYENDHSLDSGVWYKFIRDGGWRAYDYTMFIGEGGLLTRRTSLSALLTFAAQRGVHFVGAAHEKRRLPKTLVERYRKRGYDTAMDEYHDRMMAETFAVFCRDPDFRAVYDSWRSDFSPETQNHVPDIWPATRLERRLRARIQRRYGSPFLANGHSSWLDHVVAEAPMVYDRMGACAALRLRADGHFDAGGSYIHVNTVRRRVTDVVEVEEHNGVRFHREDGPEWFAGSTIHLFSRTFLERLTSRLERFGMYDVLDLPFAASALELVWGFMPAWLGLEKWFSDAVHRVRKNFVNYVREDYPPEMAGYINRYFRGDICVDWEGDYLKIKDLRPALEEHMRGTLPPVYFA